MEAKPELRTISVAHSPDSDDAFMFYANALKDLELRLHRAQSGGKDLS